MPSADTGLAYRYSRSLVLPLLSSHCDPLRSPRRGFRSRPAQDVMDDQADRL